MYISLEPNLVKLDGHVGVSTQRKSHKSVLIKPSHLLIILLKNVLVLIHCRAECRIGRAAPMTKFS